MPNPFRGLAASLNPNTPLQMAPQARSQLVQLLMQSQSQPGYSRTESGYGTAAKLVQALKLRKAMIGEREAANLKEGRQSALAGALSRAGSGGAQGEAAKRAALIISGGLPEDPLAQSILSTQAKQVMSPGGEDFTLSPGQTRYNSHGKPIASAANTPDPTKVPDLVNEITDDLYKESQTFNVQLANIGNVRASISDPSPAGDMGLVYGYMKMLDPTSAVREAEYATAENARGVPAGIRNVWNRLLNGQRLDEDQRKDFSNRAERYFAQERANQSRRNDRFLARAVGSGIPREMFSQYLLPLDPSQAQQLQAPAAPTPQQPIPAPVGPPVRVIR